LPLVLASSSPQRKRLLESLDVSFTVRPSDVEELEQGEDPAAVALENALRKARAARIAGAGGSSAGGDSEVVIGCDTIVVLDGVIYGKPPDAQVARRTIAALAGRTHEVMSGLAVLLPGEERTAVARTAVSFRALDDEQLDWYVSTGEWRGRSGGYAIQGVGSKLVLSVDGEEENVVGLPLATLLELYPQLTSG
jgi:septum formation protein